MSDETPRTDAEHAKTLTPAYEYEGAETEAWEWARKLEKELREATGLLQETLDDHKGWNDCNDGRECQWCVDAKELISRPKEPLPFSELF